MGKLRIFGVLLVLASVATFVLDLGPVLAPNAALFGFPLWHNGVVQWILDTHVLLSPLTLFTPLIIGNNPVVVWGFSWILNGILLIMWPFILLGLGLILLK